MIVIWTSLARRRLRQVHRRLARVNEAAALRVVGDITARSGQLERFPDSGRALPEFENRYLRELIEGEYRVTYERFPDRVEIITVMHAAMSLDTELGN